jgi:hypothetical protein
MRRLTLVARAARALLLLTLLGALGGVAHAQVPEREEAFVYGLNAAIARTFTGTFAPPASSTIYLLADRTSVISPRKTEIYFWPITNDYKANWSILNEPVPGTLEILQRGRVIQAIEPTDYTIHYQREGSEVIATLFTAADAVAAQERFAASQKAYQQASREFFQQQQAWLALAGEANQRIARGEQATIPPAPTPPEPLTVSSNGLNNGVPVQLPAGSYQIRVRAPDGSIVPSSTRDLVVFAPRRASIGYMVVPATRWTTPDQIEDPAAVIVGKANSQLYLVPHEAREYPAEAYALLQNPQTQVGQTAEWQWVLGSPIQQGELEVLTPAGAERRQLTPYRVQQAPGATLGYEILPFERNPERPNAQPDLVGFPLPMGEPGSRLEVRMISPQGQVLAGSVHQVHVPSAPPLLALVLIAAIPLAAGSALIVRRRRRMRLPRNVNA